MAQLLFKLGIESKYSKLFWVFFVSNFIVLFFTYTGISSGRTWYKSYENKCSTVPNVRKKVPYLQSDLLNRNKKQIPVKELMDNTPIRLDGILEKMANYDRNPEYKLVNVETCIRTTHNYVIAIINSSGPEVTEFWPFVGYFGNSAFTEKVDKQFTKTEIYQNEWHRFLGIFSCYDFSEFLFYLVIMILLTKWRIRANVKSDSPTFDLN